jgi:PAS domain S-box-containing protein
LSRDQYIKISLAKRLAGVRTHRAAPSYLVALGAILLAFLLRSALNPLVGNAIPNASGYLAVVLVSWIAGRGPGIFVTLAWLPLAWSVWAGPSHAFRIDAGVITNYCAYLVVCGAIVFALHSLRKVEAELELERDRFLTTLGALDEAVIVVDLQDRIRFLNDRAAELIGCDRINAIARAFGEVVNLIDRDSGAPVVRVASPEIIGGRQNILIAEGFVRRRYARDVSVSNRVAALKTAQGKVFGVVLTLSDVTQQKQYEDELLTAESRKDEFLAILAHELRNPLSPLQSALAVLQKSACEPAKMQAATDIMQRQLDQLVRLVDDLMDVSRIQTGRLELRPSILTLNKSIVTAIEASQPFFDQRRQTLSVELGDDVAIRGDAARITQIFTNLLNNASKYTPERGAVSVVSRQEGGEILISIADTGIGLSAEDTQKIFDLFTRIDSGRKAIDGLGIGLALAKQLAVMHGGRIAVKSAGPQQGSTFTLVLPVYEKIQAAATAAVVEPAENAARQFRKILLVDDNVDGTAALASLLELMDFEVVVANSGVEALERLKTFLPDAAVLDIGLPDISGFELARRMRAAQIPSLKKLIALSGWGTKKDIEAALECGFDEHVTKPITVEQISSLL